MENKNHASIFLGLLMSTFLINAENGFDVIGITARTTNQAEMQGTGIIPQLWQQFFVEQVFEKIPNKADHTVVAVYYDFASDKNGEYNILIGARVKSTDMVPAGMVAVHIPTEKKTIFTTAKGQMPKIVIDTWQEIWNLENQNRLNRTYQADYELYDERSQDPVNAQAEIHIGIR